MTHLKTLIALFSIFLFISCKSEYQLVLNAPDKIQVNNSLTITVNEKSSQPIDSVQFTLGSKKIISKLGSASINISEFRLGKHQLTAIVFFKNKTKKLTKTLYLLAAEAPKIYTYKIINVYPHDEKAYTQGLEYFKGYLYEGTGRNGASWLRKVDLKTGKVLQQIDLPRKYFGEGITIFNNKIHQLTWKGGLGFVYDLESFEKLKEFKYTKSREGWGLTHDGNMLIKTDGTERIWFLNPKSLVEESYIEAYTNKRKVEKLNELEFVNGKIYANVWQQNSILIVNPKNGAVEGVANLNSLKAEIQKEQNLDEADEVLNGIAFDQENNRLFVTGKHWGKLYEIELIQQ